MLKLKKEGYWRECYLLLGFFFLALFQCFPQSRLDSLRTVYGEQTNHSLKALTGIKFSREIHRNKHKEETDYSIAQEAIQLALNTGDELLYARTLDNLGLLYRYHQRYDEAFPLHVKAFGLVEDKEVDPIQKMIFANNAGVAARYDERYDSAVLYYMKALKMAEEEENLQNIAISSNGIGNSLGHLSGREEEALQYFQRSLEAEKARGNSLGIAMNYLSIADYYIEKEDFNRAREYLEELLRINRDRNDEYGLAITYEFLGKSYLREANDLQKASNYFKNSLSRFQKLEDLHKQAEILLSLGRIAREENNLFQAEDFFLQSLAISKKLDQHGLLMENSLKLSELYEVKEQPSRALQYLKEGKAFEDSIKLSEQNIQIAALTRQYDFEKKEDQIQLLETDRALQQTLLENQRQKLERRRTLLLVFAIGFILIFVILLLQYRNSRTKRRTNAKLQQEEKEKMKAIYERNLARAEILVTRLRINPHFLFNSLNAITYLIQSQQNAKAMKYLVVFSRYTRMVLETSQKHVVTLAEELKLTRYYLTLEENRFEKDFTYKIIGDDAQEVDTALIPPLLLQPFIENAIWHGLLPSRKPEKQLLIEVLSQDDTVRILIDDNGVGRKNIENKRDKDHTSMGLKIIQERIDLYNKSYSGNIQCEVIDKRSEDGAATGTRILLVLAKTGAVHEAIKKVS